MKEERIFGSSFCSSCGYLVSFSIKLIARNLLPHSGMEMVAGPFLGGYIIFGCEVQTIVG